MHRTFIFVCCVVVAAVVFWALKMNGSKNTFQLTSNDIIPNQMLNAAQVYNAHGCSGKNISPQLAWANVPKATQSFAIICHDPDAPHANGWYHWLVVNIPSEVMEIPAGGKVNGALETVTSFNENAYGGACPPIGHGVHHYNFTVYALDVPMLDVDAKTAPTEVEKLVQAHALAKATITGLYERK